MQLHAGQSPMLIKCTPVLIKAADSHSSTAQRFAVLGEQGVSDCSEDDPIPPEHTVAMFGEARL